MAKRTSGTTDLCCLTCGAYQVPGGGDQGLCFEPRHKSKQALFVRETAVCQYWHGKPLQLDKPSSLADRIFAALYFSNGGAPRGCREICDWIDLETVGQVLTCDVARILEHEHSKGRVVQREPGARLNECLTWVGRYKRILSGCDHDGEIVRFELAPETAEKFTTRFASYVSEFRKRGAA